MKNNLLSITRRSIPYLPQLRPLTGSVTASILMQQLDYWFSQKPDGFYKFLSPCNHEACKPGDSWEEELAFSLDEFRSAFDRIGIRHTSKKAFDVAVAADTVFTDIAGHQKFYSSYHDRIKGLTFYFRNHSVADAALDSLVYGSPPVNGKTQFTEMGKPNLRKWENPIYGDGKTQSHLYTEITSENTHKKESADFLKKEQPEEDLTPHLTQLAENSADLIPQPANLSGSHSSAAPPQPQFEKDKDFQEFLENVYLPKTPHYQRLGITPGNGLTWIQSRKKDGRIEEIGIQYAAFKKWQQERLEASVRHETSSADTSPRQPPASTLPPAPGTDPHWDAIQRQIDEERNRPRVRYVPPQRKKIGVNNDA